MNGNATGRSFKRTALIVCGAFLGAFFFYLAFRDISWRDLADGLWEVNPLFLIPSILLVILIQVVRAFRFGLIVSPFCRLGMKDLWDLMNIWAALNMIVPARLAELVRPYLLRQAGAPFSSGIGAMMVERFFDLTGILTLLGVVLWSTPQIPVVYSFLGKVLVAILACVYALVLLVLLKRDRARAIAGRFFVVFPQRASSIMAQVFDRLIDGLGIMASAGQALLIFVCSIAIWTLFSALTYLFLDAFSVKVPFLVAITVQVFLCFGVALPSAPGFVGTFHAAGRYALALFGVAAVPAVSFATVYHVFSLVACSILGGISYWTGVFNFEQGMFGGRNHTFASRSETVPGISD